MNQNSAHRRRGANRAPLVLLLTLIFLLIGIIAVSFAIFVIDDMNGSQKLRPIAMIAVSDEIYPNQVFPGKLAAAAVSVRKAELASAAESGVPVQNSERILVETTVPLTLPVADSYFDDAIFIGDSISLGIKLSRVLPQKNIIAEKSVSLTSVVNGEAVYDAKKKTMFQAIDAQVPNPAKIYILLGTNGLPWSKNEEQITEYGQLIDQLREKYPSAMIYAESLTPKQQRSDYDAKFDKAKIDDFNVRLKELAAEKKIYYLDIQTTLKDENGWLKSAYAAPDGLHMVQKGHQAVIEYCKTHAVQPDGWADAVVK